MGRGFRIAKVLGIDIRLDYSWFIVFALLAWSLGAGVFPGFGFSGAEAWILGFTAALLLFGSVLIHELAHALVARSYGIEVRAITLFLFGGVAQIKSEPPSPRAEFLIAGVGPLVSVLFGLACLGAAWALQPVGLPAATALLLYLGSLNVALAVFNLIPGFPLDGGRLFRSTVWHFTGDLRKATRWATISGQAFAWLMIAAGIWRVASGDIEGLWLAFIGWYLNSSAQAAYQQLLLRGALAGVPVTEVMLPEPPQVDGDMRVRDLVQNYLLQSDFSFYPVVRQGEFLGVVTVQDVQNLARNLWGVTCLAALAHPPDEEGVLEDDHDAWDALTQMVENDVPRLLVLHHGQVEGVVSRESILRLVRRKLRLRLPVSG